MLLFDSLINVGSKDIMINNKDPYTHRLQFINKNKNVMYNIKKAIKVYKEQRKKNEKCSTLLHLKFH